MREDIYFSKHTNLQTRYSVEHQVNSDVRNCICNLIKITDIKVRRKIGSNVVQLPDLTNKKNHRKEKSINQVKGKTRIRIQALFKMQGSLKIPAHYNPKQFKN